MTDSSVRAKTRTIFQLSVEGTLVRSSGEDWLEKQRCTTCRYFSIIFSITIVDTNLVLTDAGIRRSLMFICLHDLYHSDLPFPLFLVQVINLWNVALALLKSIRVRSSTVAWAKEAMKAPRECASCIFLQNSCTCRANRT